MFFGLGSFTMRDWLGGLIVGSTELLGIIMIATGEDEYHDYSGGHYNTYTEKNGFFYAGIIFYTGGAAFGFARPFLYDKALAKKNSTYYALGGNPTNNISLTPVATHDGFRGVSLLYSASF